MTPVENMPSWPRFLDRDLLEAYLQMDYRTIASICPVQPLDFGRRVLLYSRAHIDAWSDTLPTRLPKLKGQVNTLPEPPPEPEISPADDDLADSLARVRARMEKPRHGTRRKRA